MNNIEKLLITRNIYGSNEENIDDYMFILLKKQNYLENDIFPVFVNKNCPDNRIGWIFPIDTIFSSEHNYKNNHHFAIYAQLLADYLEKTFVANTGINYEDYHYIILNKVRSQSNNIYDFNNLICSMIKYGYYKSSSIDKVNYYTNVQTNANIIIARDNKALILKGTNIKDFPYFFDLFENRLKIENHYYLRFILLYQIYEYLMERKFYQTVNDYEKSNINLGSVREKMSELSSEKKLINKLFSDAKLPNTPDKDFELLCRDFLKDFKDDNYFIDDFYISKLIYDIRNILVHNFYKYNGDENSIKEIVDRVELITIEVVEKIYTI